MTSSLHQNEAQLPIRAQCTTARILNNSKPQNLCAIVKHVWFLFVFNLDGLKLENEITISEAVLGLKLFYPVSNVCSSKCSTVVNITNTITITRHNQFVIITKDYHHPCHRYHHTNIFLHSLSHLRGIV